MATSPEKNIVIVEGCVSLPDILTKYSIGIQPDKPNSFLSMDDGKSYSCCYEGWWYEINIDTRQLLKGYQYRPATIKPIISSIRLEQLLSEEEMKKQPNILPTLYLVDGGEKLSQFLDQYKFDKNGFNCNFSYWKYAIKGKKIIGASDGSETSGFKDYDTNEPIDLKLYNVEYITSDFQKMLLSDPNQEIIGYFSTVECYGWEVGTLFVKERPSYNWYIPEKGVSEQSVPASLVEMYFTPAYKKDLTPNFPEIHGYKGELTKTGVQYGCQRHTFNQIKELIEVINKYNIQGTMLIGNKYAIDVEQIKQVYDELVRIGKI